jgi:hypothetical protein
MLIEFRNGELEQRITEARTRYREDHGSMSERITNNFVDMKLQEVQR